VIPAATVQGFGTPQAGRLVEQLQRGTEHVGSGGGLAVAHGAGSGYRDGLLAAISLPRLSLGIIPLKATLPIWPANAFVIFDDRMVMIETYSLSGVSEPVASMSLTRRHRCSYGSLKK
jgi:hypothetical protein